MNEKTAKLLNRYAAHVKSDAKERKAFYRQLKDDWDRMTAEQRRKQRYLFKQAIKAE